MYGRYRSEEGWLINFTPLGWMAVKASSDKPATISSGVAGVADTRIQAAYQTLADAKLPITPAKLATRTLTGYPTALRWLKITVAAFQK